MGLHEASGIVMRGVVGGVMGGREVDKVWLVVYVCMLRYEVPCSMLSILCFAVAFSVACNVLCMAALVALDLAVPVGRANDRKMHY
jgi:hypothetical protein